MNDEIEPKRTLADMMAAATAKEADAYEEAAKRDPHQVWHYHDLLKAPPKQWLIEGVLGKDDLAMLVGPSGIGKTFIALEMACAIIRGSDPGVLRQTLFAKQFPVRGKHNVVYATGEKWAGIPARVIACMDHWNLEEDERGRFTCYSYVPQLFGAFPEGPESVKGFCERVRHDTGPVSLLIIDTLHNATIGMDENTAQDTGVALLNLKHIQNELKCSILLTHHTGKVAIRGARGSSALKASISNEVTVMGTSRAGMLHITKSADSDQARPVPFSIHAEIGKPAPIVDWTGKVNGKALIQSLIEEDGPLTRTHLEQMSGFTTSYVAKLTTQLVEDPASGIQECRDEQARKGLKKSEHLYESIKNK